MPDPEQLERQTLETLAGCRFTKLRMCVFPKSYQYNTNEPQHYPFAFSDKPALQWLNNQLIKAKPDFHKRTLRMGDLTRVRSSPRKLGPLPMRNCLKPGRRPVSFS